MDQISREAFPWLRRVRDGDHAATQHMDHEALVAYFHERAAAVNAKLGVRLTTRSEAEGREIQLARLNDGRSGASGVDD